MLAKTERLSRAEFTRYFTSGRRYHTPGLLLVHTPNDRCKGSVVVGKKVAKLAVDRNRLRRRLYHRLAEYWRSSGVTGVFIIIAKPPFNGYARARQQQEMTDLLAQVSQPAST